MNHIKAVIFDFWQVIGVKKRYVLDSIADDVGLDYGVVRPYFLGMLVKMERGDITEETFWTEFKKEFGLKAELQTKTWLEHYQDIMQITPEVVAIIRQLRAKGLKIGLLSNADVAAALQVQSLGVTAEFDEVVFSAHVNLLKPDPEIYKVALKRLGVKPEESIFIDDKQENIDGANALGIHGILFTGAPQLRKDLRALLGN